jgi:hypothetical protein
MRLLIDDAPTNFARYRGENRTPNEPVITAFDIALSVEGAYDTYLSLLDYDQPRVHIVLYSGPDLAAAALTFELFAERVRPFAAVPGTLREFTQGDEANPLCWVQVCYQTAEDVSVTVTDVSLQKAPTGATMHEVRIEIAGAEIECIQGSPEDSPWHIIFGDSPGQPG